MVNVQSLIHTYIFSQKSKDIGRGFVYLPSLLSFLVCVFFVSCQGLSMNAYVTSGVKAT